MKKDILYKDSQNMWLNIYLSCEEISERGLPSLYIQHDWDVPIPTISTYPKAERDADKEKDCLFISPNRYWLRRKFKIPFDDIDIYSIDTNGFQIKILPCSKTWYDLIEEKHNPMSLNNTRVPK